MHTIDILLAALLGYLLGSIPFGFLLTRFAGKGDVRNIGSGSTGATNVLRTGSKGLAAATVLLDAGKGVVAVVLARTWLPGLEGIAAVGAIVGHCFPVWLGFRGGKGFATAAGVCLALAWPVMVACAAIWAAVLAMSRISSVSSMVTMVAAPLLAWVMGYHGVIVTLIAVAVVVIVQHRGNIARLRAGTEPKVGAKG